MAQGGGKPSGKGGKPSGKQNGKPAGKSGKPAGKSGKPAKGKPAKGKASKGDKGANAISTSSAIYSCIFMLIFCSGSMCALYAQSQTGMGAGGLMML
jgi:hypothetical protein